MINKALFIQKFITFMLPLTVALIHSYFAIREISTLIEAMGNIDILINNAGIYLYTPIEKTSADELKKPTAL